MILAKFGALAMLLAIFSVCCSPACATTVRIRAVDPAGGNLSKVLVIVRSLDGSNGEPLRALTAADGSVPDVDVPPGLYEAIATYPYFVWETTVKDFMVGNQPLTLNLQLDMELGQRGSLDNIDWHVKVVDARGRPVANAWVIGRHLDGPAMSVARTDSYGNATVAVPIRDAFITVFYKGSFDSQHFQPYPHLAQCQSSCFLRARAKLKKRPRTITLTPKYTE